MEQDNVDILRKCKRSIQTKLILRRRKKKFQEQTKVQSEYILERLRNASCLFITHDNEGGTRAYEEMNIDRYPDIVILRRLRYDFMKDMYFRIEMKAGSEVLFYLIKIENLEKIFTYEYEHIIVNSLVTYHCYDKILNILISYKKTNPNSRIQYFVHDYHSVCPSVNLLINKKYCELECQRVNCNLHIGNTTVDIQVWRNMWGKFFAIVDEIMCFSESSKEIIIKAYPLVDATKIIVKAHDISYCVCNPIPNLEKLPLCIGIVGAVYTVEKGKTVVCDIVRRYGNNIPIRIIGVKAWRYGLFKRKVKYIGPYKRDELRNILIEQKVSIVIFPSLCPETFSYLISELMAVDIPIICFNFGAQAEKIRKYHKGIVCNTLEEIYRIIDEYNCTCFMD